MASRPPDALREVFAIEHPRVVIVVGSGMSVAASGKSEASWGGLLKSGLEECRTWDPSLTQNWFDRKCVDLQSSDLDEALGVAQQVHAKLLRSSSGAVGAWLRKSVGSLKPVERRGLEALRALSQLGTVLVTTNYDDLLEQVTGLPAATWLDRPEVHRVLRGDEKGVLHWHGFWKSPESVILGIESYERVRQDKNAQAVMQALAMTHCLVFVGCGDGLGDPNFRQFFDWLGSVNGSNEANHWRLALDRDVPVLQKFHHGNQRVQVVGYGPSHGDLAGFLEQLVPESAKSRSRGVSKTSVRRKARSTVSDALREYRRRLDAETSKLHLIGLGRGVPVDLPIEKAYIPLRADLTRTLIRKDLGRFDEMKGCEGDVRERDVSLSGVFEVAAKFGQRGVLLLGDPGSGKTTGARQFCWRLIHPEVAGNTPGLPAEIFPVFLRLRNLTPSMLGEASAVSSGRSRRGKPIPATGLRALVEVETSTSALPEALGHPAADLLERRSVLWVFDGLDEVVNEETRVRVCQWIRDWLKDREGDFVLVTSRYQGHRGPVDIGADLFCQFHVQPLDESQVTEFVGRWYRAVFERLFGTAEVQANEAKAEAESNALLGLLSEPAYRVGRLRELPANPLLLTILCLVHHEDHSLPRKRADVYARCLRVLIEYWRQEVRKLQNLKGFDPGAAESVLATVAWWLHAVDQRTTAALAELEEQAQKALAEIGESAGLGRSGKEFIGRMLDDSGVLALWGSGQCGFLHLTFQEYLAGWFGSKEGKAREMAARLANSWWREAILVALAVGPRAFAMEFFTALLETNPRGWDVTLIDQCLDEASVVPIEPFVGVLSDEKRDPDERAAILRRARLLKNPELIAACRELVRSEHRDLANTAREILERFDAKEVRPRVEVVWRAFEVRVEPKSGVALVALPGGSFRMGSEKGNPDERPVHTVRLSPFAIGKYAVTNAEYGHYLEANPKAAKPRYWDDSPFNDPRQPVVGISWDEARAFCAWAGGRLPTEAEWEYACRAGTVTEYHFGDEERRLSEYGWFGEPRGRTHPVGEKLPNAWGLFDMHGNVSEWCEDRVDEGSDFLFGNLTYIEGIVDPVSEDGAWRILRGWGFWDSAWKCRSASRSALDPVTRYRDIGFRLAAGLS